MLVALLLIIIGGILLARNLGLIILPASFWSLFYPVLLIVIGVYIAMGVQKGKHYRDMFFRRRKNRQDVIDE